MSLCAKSTVDFFVQKIPQVFKYKIFLVFSLDFLKMSNVARYSISYR